MRNAGRIRIAHVITRLELGGAQQNTLYCCERHDRKRYEVVLIAGKGGDLDAQALRQSPRTTVHLLPELKHPIRPWWDVIAFFRLVRLLRRERIDLVHTHSSKAGILGRWAARLAGVPCVVHTVHGWGFHPRQFAPLRWLYQALEKWSALVTDALIVVAQENAREGLAARIGRPPQYRVIHSGIVPSLYRVPSARAARVRKAMGTAKRPCVLVLSNFKPQKSPMDVVRVVERLRLLVPDVLLAWAGGGPGREAVERAVRERGLQDHFILLGWRTDVADLLGACDALLLTSLFEGLPRVVLQAFAAGKPVVATAVSGTPEAVAHGVSGFLHPPHDAEGMAVSLSVILKDRRIARRMGAAGGRVLKGSFLMPGMLREIEDLYEEVSRRKGVV